MITFDLRCDSEHRFEGWFRNREDFEDQMQRGLVTCPLCGSRSVSKELSAVSVHVARRTAPASPASGQEAQAGPERPPGAPVAQPLLRAFAEFVEKNFDDVGDLFAREARRMEEGEAPVRNIRGTSTEAEEEALREDGIEFFKVALPKYDA